MEIYGKILYHELLKPLESELKTNRDIIIIPDRYLAKIPYESFIIDEKKSGRPLFLLEKYLLKYMQSSSLLSVLRIHYQRNRETNNFIAFGDPAYDYDNFKQGKPEFGNPNPVRGDEITEIHRGKYLREGSKLGRMSGSGDEVNIIAELFKNKNQTSIVHLRINATEENAKKADMNEFVYIHFACHGILGDIFLCLVLSQVPAAKEDGYFTMNEIMNCDYNAKLVVLSACQTDSGIMERSEGVTGLTRAVMYAGTRTVIASLWKVDDRAAKEFMVRFYKNLLEKKMEINEALRQAKLSLLKTEKYSSSIHWGAFVLY
jgi:CHAT domain-containing protein